MPDNSISYQTIREGPSLTYLRKGIFEFKGIEFDIEEAKFLADTIAEILTGKQYLITRLVKLNKKEELIKDIDRRLHSSNIPYSEGDPL